MLGGSSKLAPRFCNVDFGGRSSNSGSETTGGGEIGVRPTSTYGPRHGRAPCCSLLAGSRLVGHRLEPALLVGAIFLFQPPGCLDYVLDLSATKLITLEQR